MPDNTSRFQKKDLVRRSTKKRAAGRVVAIAYDGEKTEAEYFRGWSRKLGSVGVSIQPYYVKSGGNALVAVEACIDQVAKDGPFDETWCVCDVDDTSKANLQKAIALAKRNKIKLCLSCRCFEIWLALHWDKVSLACIQTEVDAVSLVSKIYKPYTNKNKYVPFDLLFAKTQDACDNADWLLQQSLHNPKTEVHILVKELLKIYKSKIGR